MVHNRRNSLAMAGLVDNENAENLQVNDFLGILEVWARSGPEKIWDQLGPEPAIRPW